MKRIVGNAEEKKGNSESSESQTLREKANGLYKRKKLKDARAMYTKVIL